MLTTIRSGFAGLQTFIAGVAVSLVAILAALPAEAQEGNWAGFYAGVNAGGAWGNSDTNIGCDDSTFAFGPFCRLATAQRAIPFNMSTDQDGFIGGVQAGYNFQRGHMVFGIEADIAWTSIDGSQSVTTAPTLNFPTGNDSRVSQKLNYLGTVRGRLGYAMHNNFLLFATGGLAYGDVDNRYAFEFQTVGGSATASQSKTKTGWTVGGGGEYSFGHWSLKGEYLYYDLGEERLSGQFIDAVNGPQNVYLNPKFETKGQLVRVGLNFKFGHRADAPVPLK